MYFQVSGRDDTGYRIPTTASAYGKYNPGGGEGVLPWGGRVEGVLPWRENRVSGREQGEMIQDTGFQQQLPLTVIKSRSTASARLSAYAHWLQTHRQTPQVVGQTVQPLERKQMDVQMDRQMNATKCIISLASWSIIIILPWMRGQGDGDIAGFILSGGVLRGRVQDSHNGL